MKAVTIFLKNDQRKKGVVLSERFYQAFGCPEPLRYFTGGSASAEHSYLYA